jgi:hypothetical protein
VNGILSKEEQVTCGIPQGSIIGPLLFIIYINDFPKCLNRSIPGMFADDTYITTASKDIRGIEEILNEDLAAVNNWLRTNKLSCNSKKTNYMTIGSRQNLRKGNSMDLLMNNHAVKQKECTKLLGVYIDESLNWDDHIKHVTSKALNGLRMLYKTRNLTNDRHFKICL